MDEPPVEFGRVYTVGACAPSSAEMLGRSSLTTARGIAQAVRMGDAAGGRTAVGDDDRRAHPGEDGAAELVGIQRVLEAQQVAAQEQAAEFGLGGEVDGLPQGAEAV